MDLRPDLSRPDWIEDLTDAQCMEIFWLYVMPPEPFLQKYPPPLLGRAMRQVLREIARWQGEQSAARLPDS